MKSTKLHIRWVHRRCCGNTGILKLDPTFRFKRYTEMTRPVDGRPMTEVTKGTGEALVGAILLLPRGDCLSSGGDCELASITRCCVTWETFYKLPAVTLLWCTPWSQSIISWGRVYNSCVRNVMLYESETWAPASSDLHGLQRMTGLCVIRWMCGVTTKDQVSSQDISLRGCSLEIPEKIICTSRLRWYSHVECSDGWLKTMQKLNPTGGRGHGHP